MAGPKTSAQRAKLSKHLRGGTKKKRMKADTEQRAAYRAKKAARKAKDMKRRSRKKG